MKELREWIPPICHQVGRSNTGIPGITETTVRGRTCFSVSLRPKANQRCNATVYYGCRGVTREAALQRAKDLRFATIAQRVKDEGRIVP